MNVKGIKGFASKTQSYKDGGVSGTVDFHVQNLADISHIDHKEVVVYLADDLPTNDDSNEEAIQRLATFAQRLSEACVELGKQVNELMCVTAKGDNVPEDLGEEPEEEAPAELEARLEDAMTGNDLITSFEPIHGESIPTEPEAQEPAPSTLEMQIADEETRKEDTPEPAPSINYSFTCKDCGAKQVAVLYRDIDYDKDCAQCPACYALNFAGEVVFIALDDSEHIGPGGLRVDPPSETTDLEPF